MECNICIYWTPEKGCKHKEPEKGQKIIQGNREFIQVTKYAWYIYKVDGKYYNGKSFQYYKCPICGQLVCHMMGGASRHHEMHERKGDIKKAKP